MRKSIEIETVQKAIQQIDKGDQYYNSKQYRQAITCYDQALELGSNSIAYHNRASAYAKLKNYQAAIADFTLAIKLDPDYASAYFRRGAVYQQLKQYQKAIADSAKAVELAQNLAKQAQKLLNKVREAEQAEQEKTKEKIPPKAKLSVVSGSNLPNSRLQSVSGISQPRLEQTPPSRKEIRTPPSKVTSPANSEEKFTVSVQPGTVRPPTEDGAEDTKFQCPKCKQERPSEGRGHVEGWGIVCKSCGLSYMTPTHRYRHSFRH